MKYRQLTKEQFESLHEEFAHFLASQQIDAKEWKQIKEQKPEVAQDEMNVFSDVVWDDVLTRVSYIDHFSPKVVNLFKCEATKMTRIVIQINKEIDVTTKEGYEWLLNHTTDNSVDILTGEKQYVKERNPEIFTLIEQGGNISKGELFEYFYKIIN